MPEPSRQFEQGQCATPVPVAGEKLDLGGVELDAMGMPDIVAGPAQILGILSRPAAEFFQRLGHVLVVLGQMGVQPHPLVPGQRAPRRASVRG